MSVITTKRMRNDRAIKQSVEITRKRSQWADIVARLSRNKIACRLCDRRHLLILVISPVYKA